MSISEETNKIKASCFNELGLDEGKNTINDFLDALATREEALRKALVADLNLPLDTSFPDVLRFTGEFDHADIVDFMSI